MRDIENVPEYIYNKLLNDERIFIFIGNKPLVVYLDELENFDFRKFIIYHLSNYPKGYCIKIFVRVLSLWKRIKWDDQGKRKVFFII